MIGLTCLGFRLVPWQYSIYAAGLTPEGAAITESSAI
jgi:hypothetical protein